MRPPSWTPERIATLERLWTDGLSAGEIAARLPGVTRNAVLGKLHRLGRLGRGRPTTSGRARQVKPSSPPAKRRLQPSPDSRPPPSSPAAPTWSGEVAEVEALQPWHCRWPIGDPRQPGFAFCGRHAEARPYCEAHWATACRTRAKTRGELAVKLGSLGDAGG